MNEKIKNKDEINSCLFFSKTFLSFSKDIDVAKGFIGNETEKRKIYSLFYLKLKD